MSETMDPRQRFLFSTLPGLLGQAYNYVRQNPFQATADVAQAVSPGGALQDALAGSEQISRSALRGEIGGMVGGAGTMGAGLLGAIPLAGMVSRGVGSGIRAYHGTPHKFDQFDLAKVGSGEGAQSYGHGLYFAESEPVARWYRDVLTRNQGRDYVWRDASGREFDINRMSQAAEKGDPLGIAASMLRQSKSVQESIDDVTRYGPGAFSGGQRDYDAALKGLRSLQESGLQLVPGGNMYEVRLNARPREFLDWDLPLSQQSKEVQESLTRFGLRADPQAARAYDDALLGALESDKPVTLPKMPRDPLGSEIYQRELRMAPEEASQALMNAGIPGTRYLDQGSRGVGGTYNYAVFDPEIVDILRRYGLLGTVGAGAAMAGAQEMQQ